MHPLKPRRAPAERAPAEPARDGSCLRRAPAAEAGLVLAELLLALMILGAVLILAGQRNAGHLAREEERSLAATVEELQQALARYYRSDFQDLCHGAPKTQMRIRDTAAFPQWLRNALRRAHQRSKTDAASLWLWLDNRGAAARSRLLLRLPTRNQARGEALARRLEAVLVPGQEELYLRWTRPLKAPPPARYGNSLLDRDLHCATTIP